jgi:hypothetical protein
MMAPQSPQWRRTPNNPLRVCVLSTIRVDSHFAQQGVFKVVVTLIPFATLIPFLPLGQAYTRPHPIGGILGNGLRRAPQRCRVW